MTKQQAIDLFKDTCPERKQWLDHDLPALRMAWNNFTDSLCKEGQITEHQYDTWVVSLKELT